MINTDWILVLFVLLQIRLEWLHAEGRWHLCSKLPLFVVIAKIQFPYTSLHCQLLVVLQMKMLAKILYHEKAMPFTTAWEISTLVNINMVVQKIHWLKNIYEENTCTLMSSLAWRCVCVRMRREPKGKRINIKTHFFIKRNSYINMEHISKLSGTIH